MLEPPAQMVIFDTFFCPRNEICPSKSNLPFLFLWSLLLLLTAPFQYKHSVAPCRYCKPLFFYVLLLKRRRWHCKAHFHLPGHLGPRWSRKEAADNSDNANVISIPILRELWVAPLGSRADPAFDCKRWELVVLAMPIRAFPFAGNGYR